VRRVVRDAYVAEKYKRNKRLCEHCAWRAIDSSMLHAHHVVPLACGGPDTPENMIVLCPTCHSIAHYVTRQSYLTRQYTGPVTALELRRWMAAARKPRQLKELQRGLMMAHVGPILAEMRA
jgi:hypothetical protein